MSRSTRPTRRPTAIDVRPRPTFYNHKLNFDQLIAAQGIAQDPRFLQVQRVPGADLGPLRREVPLLVRAPSRSVVSRAPRASARGVFFLPRRHLMRRVLAALRRLACRRSAGRRSLRATAGQTQRPTPNARAQHYISGWASHARRASSRRPPASSGRRIELNPKLRTWPIRARPRLHGAAPVPEAVQAFSDVPRLCTGPGQREVHQPDGRQPVPAGPPDGAAGPAERSTQRPGRRLASDPEHAAA